MKLVLMHRFVREPDHPAVTLELHYMRLNVMKLKGNGDYFLSSLGRARRELNRLDAAFPILLTKLSTALE